MNLAAIRTVAKQKADEDASGYIGNTEVDKYVNQGSRHIYTKIAQRFENYFIVPGTALNGGLYNTVIGTDAYALPADCMKLVRLEQRRTASVTNNDWRRLSTVNLANDRLDSYYPVREGYVPGFGYFVAGNNIYLRPVPQQSFEMRLWYVPRPVTLTLDADIPSLPEEYHELIAEYAAIQMLAKSGEGIWRERSDLFKLELENMLETIEVRDQNAEQMVITDDTDFARYGI